MEKPRHSCRAVPLLLAAIATQAHAGVIFTVDEGGPSGLQADIFYTNITTCFPILASSAGGGTGSGLGLPGDKINGMSKAADDDEFVICWSVDPASSGSSSLLAGKFLLGPGLPLFRVNDQAANNQAAGDTFVSTEAFDSIGILPVPVSLGLNSNRLARNQGGLFIHDFGLLPDVGPNVFVPPGTPLDDVDGETAVPDPCALPPLFFSVASNSPSLLTLPAPASPATIYVDLDVNIPGNEFLYASPGALGLQFADDIDALSVHTLNPPGSLFDPLNDFVLLSLARGSPTLLALGASPADVFIADGTGLRMLVDHAQLGLRAIDNIDSLDTVALVNMNVTDTFDRIYTDFCPADVNNDGIVDLNDLSAVLFNFGATGNSRNSFGDVTGDGNVDLVDLSAILFNFGSICPP